MTALAAPPFMYANDHQRRLVQQRLLLLIASAISTDDQTKPGITIGELRVQHTSQIPIIDFLESLIFME